jgi:L-methionine (R)-S-oxide reductase
MAETLALTATTKAARYAELLPQIQALTTGEPDLTANLANTAAALRQAFSFFWVGFYLVKGDELVLGPFQGPIACTRIRSGRGVCGTAWAQAQTQLVPDVELFPGHIACSSESKSEIVVPILKQGQVVAVLDVDSDQLNDFDQADQARPRRADAAGRHLVLIGCNAAPLRTIYRLTTAPSFLNHEKALPPPWRLAPQRADDSRRYQPRPHPARLLQRRPVAMPTAPKPTGAARPTARASSPK